ncbi:MAG: GGDEF domain-containing protein, partial [Sulfurovum sp.]|nr:GGDEF domain-containing protein [Sulfurovum sp.]
KYFGDRFVALVVMTLIAFILSGQSDAKIYEDALLGGFTLLALILFSIVYYYFINTYPDSLVSLRKHFLVAVDLGVLTYLIIAFGETGLYLLPFYIVIIMRSGLSFGVSYFYSGLALSIVSWIAVLTYSSYWKTHYEILFVFAATTLSLPLFYLKFVMHVHEENEGLDKTLSRADEADNRYDALTQLENRSRFKEVLKDHTQKQEPFSLLFIQLDRLPAINDTHGRHIGDEVLREVANRLSSTIEKDDFLGRLGGDEFVVITRHKKDALKKYLAKLERIVMGRHKVGKTIVPIELNIGISCFPEDAQTAIMLSRYADEAMRAAQTYDDTYHCFYRETEEAEGEEEARV